MFVFFATNSSVTSPRLSPAAWSAALLLALCLACTGPSKAAEPLVDWDLLQPKSLEQTVDPFAALTEEQRWKLAFVARQRRLGFAASGTSSGDSDPQTVERELKAGGVDVDALLAYDSAQKRARRESAREANPDAVGRMVDITGFPVAGQAEDGGQQFYLVSDVRYCSHVRLPVPNQMILVSEPQNAPPLHHLKPVRVRGILEEHHTRQVVHFVDGMATVEAVYRITEAKVDLSDQSAVAPASGLMRLIQ